MGPHGKNVHYIISSTVLSHALIVLIYITPLPAAKIIQVLHQLPYILPYPTHYSRHDTTLLCLVCVKFNPGFKLFATTPYGAERLVNIGPNGNQSIRSDILAHSPTLNTYTLQRSIRFLANENL